MQKDTDDTGGGKKALLSLHSVSVSVPHPLKIHKRGEDASFLTTNAVGVFDGVGSWSRYNIDAGLYAKKLAAACENVILRGKSRTARLSSRAVLSEAVQRTTVAGTSTALVAILSSDKLNLCNVGDGGALIIRDSRISFATRPQQRAFNIPYQLGFRRRRDLSLAAVSSVSLRQGDIIVLATDGVWDNLWHSTVVWLVSQYTRRRSANLTRLSSSSSTSSPSFNNNNNSSPSPLERAAFSSSVRDVPAPGFPNPSHDALKNLAFDIAARACSAAHDSKAQTPFAERARRRGYSNGRGGKLDDITVIVSEVHTSRATYTASFHTICCDEQRNKRLSKS